MDGDAGTDFCYAGDGCVTFGGYPWHGVSEERADIIQTSGPDRPAVGVRVGLRVLAGEGRAEIVRGVSFVDDAGFRDFDAEDVIHTSDAFSAGETVRVEVGETDGP